MGKTSNQQTLSTSRQTLQNSQARPPTNKLTKRSAAEELEGGPQKKQEVEANSGEEDEDEAFHLQGFSSESDSSDEEDPDGPSLDVTKLPTIARDDATVRHKLEKAKKEPVRMNAHDIAIIAGTHSLFKSVDRGVLYLGRIPHGFYEAEMKAYFSQFGDVTRLRLSRNKKVEKAPSPFSYPSQHFETDGALEALCVYRI